MKLTTPFTILNRKFNEMDLIRDAMMISYGCVYKRSSKSVMKDSRVGTIEAARKEYAELLKEGWKKTSIFKTYY